MRDIYSYFAAVVLVLSRSIPLNSAAAGAGSAFILNEPNYLNRQRSSGTDYDEKEKDDDGVSHLITAIERD